MKVYVIDQYGKPLMPCSPAKARRLLKMRKAKTVKRTPFCIQLLYYSTSYKQDITLGIDAGSRWVGVSATTEKHELYSGEVELRNDIVNNLSTRRQFRRVRRNRKTRYRKARFLNRVKSKYKGWLAPSIEAKIGTHHRVVKEILKILPITNIIVEAAQFNIKKIENPNISGDEYQKGKQKDSRNIREYVLFRDNHKCVYCCGKSKDFILNVHHLESRKTGGNSPGNLVTLCKTCHDEYHKGKIKLNITRETSYKHAAFMGIMRRSFFNMLKEDMIKINIPVKMTYGYITKDNRIDLGLIKSHRADAYCITGNLKSKRLDIYYQQKKVRCHNRQLHKAKILRGGIRKNNQTDYEVAGYRLFDKVIAEGLEWFIFGRRKSGFFDLRDLNGNKLNKGSYSSKKIKLLLRSNSLLILKRSIDSEAIAMSL